MTWFYMYLRGNPYADDPQAAWNGDYMGDKAAKREAKAHARQYPGGTVSKSPTKPFGALDLTPYAAGSAEAQRAIQTLAEENRQRAKQLGLDHAFD